MTSKATITFSQAGVQPPVYVVTSLDDWMTLEMDVEEEHTASGDVVFTKEFSNVAEGSYQYKIRIGEGHWVVDESKESATDEHGNRNNVVHVKPASHVKSTASTADAPTTKEVTSDVAQQNTPPEPLEDQLPSIPVPFVVVEKVADEDQPEYGDAEPESLPLDAAKRTADAEPDFEEVKVDPPVNIDPPKSPEIPLLVVEKTDDKPAYGDDFGENATSSQRAAHDMRSADASPDRLVISSDNHMELESDQDEPAPLFPHESLQTDDPPPASPMETIDEESLQSSADRTSSSEVINTPSDPDESDDGNELDQSPLLPHETGLGDRNGILDNGPLLSHEIGPDDDSGIASDEEDEFDRAPLLSHETGFSDHRGSEVTTNSGFLEDDYDMEPQHYAPYRDEDEGVETRTFEHHHAPTFSSHGDQDETPLLPHERDSAVASSAGSELSADDAHYLQHGQPTFGYEGDNANDLYGGGRRSNVFRARTNSSTLPHKLPRSDAEDENLNDPSLERFPTSREQILERVASIGHHLPEDETIEDDLHSPQLSVLSQACSSVELMPVKSYTSLASVPEADDSDDEDQDVESLPSPITFSSARQVLGYARDALATPVPDDRKQLGLVEEKVQVPSARTTESSEADNIDKHDGAKDSAGILSTMREAINTPTKVSDPITPPLTPERKSTTSGPDESATAPESELRQRRELKDDSTPTSQTPTIASKDTGDSDKITRSLPRLSLSVSTTVLVAGIAVAAYYSLALAS
ncbi:uncharacterized protein K460DRAFT_277663 [Cucurbitaria berberidis CBS 394.84]|uniref:AMP-activated protein kinase glycogen-binding domain-containing protein n=1 Tax=Cucurbitaria berberidis CBS 394.84 TaxID=1168544 RepID=A0A9P4GLL4_9PLEO|nr:uncharacterized protein K460DRAFT_277663 [Cucurbitaria berberidis CBS 394.84]KAF1847300.1 hypothetical protein K460DRAFT_277663 [Cucurbitaria berberidis CBS 394.84]